MGTFTNDVQNRLYEKGIEVDDSGVSIKYTLKGMIWILNYTNIPGGIGVSLKLLLKEISKHGKNEKQWRDLIGERAIRNSFILPVDRSLPFKIEDDFVVDIEFSEQEVAELNQGKKNPKRATYGLAAFVGEHTLTSTHGR